jgi:hypothetical protein
VLGTLHRAINDFFATSGRDLPSMAFVLIGADIVAVRTWRARDRAWLPLLFSLAGLLFLAVDLLMTDLAWTLSDWVVGPRLGGIDAGYHRTWYVIAANLALWLIFWVALVKLPRGRQALRAGPYPRG